MNQKRYLMKKRWSKRTSHNQLLFFSNQIDNSLPLTNEDLIQSISLKLNKL